MKYSDISEYIYLFISIFIFCDLVFFKSSVLENKFLIGFGLLSLFMYFFRRHFRIKFNNRKNN